MHWVISESCQPINVTWLIYYNKTVYQCYCFHHSFTCLPSDNLFYYKNFCVKVHLLFLLYEMWYRQMSYHTPTVCAYLNFSIISRVFSCPRFNKFVCLQIYQYENVLYLYRWIWVFISISFIHEIVNWWGNPQCAFFVKLSERRQLLRGFLWKIRNTI